MVWMCECGCGLVSCMLLWKQWMLQKNETDVVRRGVTRDMWFPHHLVWLYCDYHTIHLLWREQLLCFIILMDFDELHIYIFMCTYILLEWKHALYVHFCFMLSCEFQCTFQQFPFWQYSVFSSVCFVLCFLACSGEMHELHADGDPDVEAPRQLQGTRAVLLFGRTQVLHPLEAVTQEWKGQEWVLSS